MAMPIYMRIEGESSGPFTGGCTVGEYVGDMQVRAFDHRISMPFDESTGHHTGRRVHQPITVTIDMDSATPLIYKSMIDHELLKVNFFYFRQNPGTGHEEQFFTTELQQATVTSVTAAMENQYDPAHQVVPHLVTVHLAYKGIIWNYVPDGIEVQDHHDSQGA